MGAFGSFLSKKSEGGDISQLPEQVKGTFGDGDIIDRADSLKGLLQNGAGLAGKLPGVAGMIGKGVSGGMALLDKGSDTVKDLTGTSGYDWLGKGAGALYNGVFGEKSAQNASGPLPQPGAGEKLIYVDNKPKIVPADQQGAGLAPPAAAPAEEAPGGDASGGPRNEPLPEVRR